MERNNFLIALSMIVFSAAVFVDSVPAATSKSKPSWVPTFHCLSVYWSPEKGAPGKKVFVEYQEEAELSWNKGLPMRYNPVDTGECKGDYRGSIVNLDPGTVYNVRLRLENGGPTTFLSAATWSEKFPVAESVKVKSGKSTYTVKVSGRPGGYILYDGTTCVINTEKKSDLGISVSASYVIIRGFTIRNVKQHGIRIMRGSHHVVIENCDISRWGSPDKTGFGRDYQAAVYSNKKDIRSIVIQRCRIHNPNTDSNSWAETHHSFHPEGPQAVVFWNSEGNHVIRYNEIWSDKDHYYNDILGGGSNGSYRGFPGADSDIYCNYIANCWDDGIEAEGGDQNVRIWNNYIEHTMIPIGNAAVSIGPLYVWRNVSGRSYSPPGSRWNLTHGSFMKMGYADGEKWMTGHMYIFNNTVFQPDGMGSGGLGGSSKIIKHCTSRNNILHVRSEDRYSIARNKSSIDNDFDYDLLSGSYPSGQEKDGIKGTPKYIPGAGFSFDSKTGIFQLLPGSPGFGRGVVIPNFCDPFAGRAPDIGAHEAGNPPMQFGVKAKGPRKILRDP